ncbi:MAG TPA: TetR/AcrR family transcriptional regulator [Syntrophorhabdaceae bacterium]|nr:TetR/AcrR family transcriptional regulator [Syntrophorhabdaceae bacterium]
MNRRSSLQSKENIKKAAFEAFSKYGYGGASMKMIAHEAGMSVGGLYLYFKNKEELYLFLIKEKLDEFSKTAENAFKIINDPVEAIVRYINISIEYAKKHKEFIITQSKEHGFTFGMEIKKKFFEEQKALILRIIKKGIENGIFKPFEPVEVAKVIMGLIRGFIISIVINPENIFDAKYCTDVILKGLLKEN